MNIEPAISWKALLGESLFSKVQQQFKQKHDKNHNSKQGKLMTKKYSWIQYPGLKIKLRKAVLEDRPIIYNWMANSNITKTMLGGPDYPDAPIPSFDEFVEDFSDSFFTEIESSGKCFIIMNDNEEIGTLCYDLMNLRNNWVVLDIWLKDEMFCGKGYGSEALKLLCIYLFDSKGINNFYISPSLRNTRAIKSYEKAGFTKLKMNRTRARKKFGVDIFDYGDNVVLKKVINRTVK
ncbi:MAG TPA: GNAT family N-acetyltransferase [Chitinispirillaceae bacterium]|nr:GNAT family N-acetyltransferase [Chitinispirillaceae bacterium]